MLFASLWLLLKPRAKHLQKKGIHLQPTGGDNKDKIIKSIEELEASGDTPGESAIMAAYQLARSTFNKNGSNRVILATDGDFNVGVSNDDELVKLIEKEREHDIFLTVLGFGEGNFQALFDAMEADQRSRGVL